jgi:hypothetical protein
MEVLSYIVAGIFGALVLETVAITLLVVADRR